MAPYLPLSGLLIGLMPALALWGAASLGLAPLLSAFLAIGVWALVTGAMQEDALADSFDGLWGGQTPERRLEIFKDSRIGAYGMLALMIGMGIRATALAQLLGFGGLGAASAWLGATIAARSLALWLAVALPPARAKGAGAAAGRLSRRAFAVGMAGAATIFGLLALPVAGPGASAIALALLVLVIVGWTRICALRVAGQTGDLIGGGQAILEIVALCTFIVLTQS